MRAAYHGFLNGRFQWQVEDDRVLTGRLFYAHETCSHEFETSRAGGGYWMWAPLAVLPAFLAKQLDIDWRDSERLGELLADL